MKHMNRITAGLAITFALLAGACTTSGGSSASAFPVGKYRNGETVAIFNADGTFEGTTTGGDDWVKGTYVASGNEVTMEDTWEGDKLKENMGKSCLGIKGRYGWTLTGDVFTATAIDDPCEGRKQGTSGVQWTRMQ